VETKDDSVTGAIDKAVVAASRTWTATAYMIMYGIATLIALWSAVMN
jgi:hypothetical protein